jgi:hypothetical protein
MENKDLKIPLTDFWYTHVRCPWARFAGWSYQMRICFAGFTVYPSNSVYWSAFCINRIKVLIINKELVEPQFKKPSATPLLIFIYRTLPKMYPKYLMILSL